MRNALRVCIFFVVALHLVACIGSKVNIAPNAAIDPAKHKTFAWEVDAIKPTGRRDGLYNIDHYLRREVTKELTDRGYQQVKRDQADFLVEYRMYQSASADQGGVTSPRDAARAGWDSSMDPNSTAIYNHYVPEQILRANVELIMEAAGSRQELWRASLSKIIEHDADDAQAIKHAMETHVPKLLRGFPKR